MKEKKAPEKQRSTVKDNVNKEAKDTDEEDEDTEDMGDEGKMKEKKEVPKDRVKQPVKENKVGLSLKKDKMLKKNKPVKKIIIRVD